MFWLQWQSISLLVTSYLAFSSFPFLAPFLCCFLHSCFLSLFLRSNQTCLIVACCTSEEGSVWALLPTGTMRFQPPWWRRFHANCSGRVTHTHTQTHTAWHRLYFWPPKTVCDLMEKSRTSSGDEGDEVLKSAQPPLCTSLLMGVCCLSQCMLSSACLHSFLNISLSSFTLHFFAFSFCLFFLATSLFRAS